MKDIFDVLPIMMSQRQLAKLLLKAYMMGIEDYGKGSLKDLSVTELKSFVNPKLCDLILKAEQYDPQGN